MVTPSDRMLSRHFLLGSRVLGTPPAISSSLPSKRIIKYDNSMSRVSAAARTNPPNRGSRPNVSHELRRPPRTNPPNTSAAQYKSPISQRETRIRGSLLENGGFVRVVCQLLVSRLRLRGAGSPRRRSMRLRWRGAFRKASRRRGRVPGRA